MSRSFDPRPPTRPTGKSEGGKSSPRYHPPPWRASPRVLFASRVPAAQPVEGSQHEVAFDLAHAHNLKDRGSDPSGRAAPATASTPQAVNPLPATTESGASLGAPLIQW